MAKARTENQKMLSLFLFIFLPDTRPGSKSQYDRMAEVIVPSSKKMLKASFIRSSDLTFNCR